MASSHQKLRATKLLKESNLSSVLRTLGKELSDGDTPALLHYFIALLSPHTSEWSMCPRYLQQLTRSYTLSLYLLTSISGITLSHSSFTSSVQAVASTNYNETDNYTLLYELLKFECNDPHILEKDPEFFRSLFIKLGSEKRQSILALGPISPAQLLFAESVEVTEDFYRFAKLRDSEYEEAFVRASSLNHRKIYYTLLRSPFLAIRMLGSLFETLYPEYGCSHPRVVPNRQEYLMDPHSIPLTEQILRTYLPVVSRINKLDKEDEAKLYYHYTLKIIGLCSHTERERLLKRVVNEWLHDIPMLLDLFLKNRPDISDMSEFTELLPISARWFKVVLSFGKITRDPWYFHLLLQIASRWPTRNHIKLLQDNILYFEVPIPENIRQMFKELK